MELLSGSYYRQRCGEKKYLRHQSCHSDGDVIPLLKLLQFIEIREKQQIEKKKVWTKFNGLLCMRKP